MGRQQELSIQSERDELRRMKQEYDNMAVAMEALYQQNQLLIRNIDMLRNRASSMTLPSVSSEISSHDLASVTQQDPKLEALLTQCVETLPTEPKQHQPSQSVQHQHPLNKVMTLGNLVKTAALAIPTYVAASVWKTRVSQSFYSQMTASVLRGGRFNVGRGPSASTTTIIFDDDDIKGPNPKKPNAQTMGMMTRSECLSLYKADNGKKREPYDDPENYPKPGDQVAHVPPPPPTPPSPPTPPKCPMDTLPTTPATQSTSVETMTEMDIVRSDKIPQTVTTVKHSAVAVGSTVLKQVAVGVGSVTALVLLESWWTKKLDSWTTAFKIGMNTLIATSVTVGIAAAAQVVLPGPAGAMAGLFLNNRVLEMDLIPQLV
eukprot:GILJ01007456.1.p1 GENE.GILJ01007456.1~~GILJ01007456.1.p1  ORF type:complete len:387 (-),score=58.37 GILJ01007456.1:26-1150(-)